MILRASMLTPEAFAPFGEVLQCADRPGQNINHGMTRKFADLGRLRVADGGEVRIHLYRSQPSGNPLRLLHMERHPASSQAFYPLHDRPFPVVVSPADTVPAEDNLRAFITDGRQGVCLRPGVWHHHQISLGQPADYLVLDAVEGSGGTEEVRVSGDIWLQV